MAHDPRKTVPMPKREPKDLGSVRRTERMGIERDTLRDLDPVETKNLPRATVPMAHAPRGKGPRSDRVEGGEVRVGSGEVPDEGEADGRVDLSRAGPRHAKTMKVARRPQEYLAPMSFEDAEGEEASARARKPARANSTFFFAVALMVLLVVLAVILLLLIAKQRGLFA